MVNQGNGELVDGVEEQTRQALVNMGHLLQVNMVRMVNMVDLVSMVNMINTSLIQAAGCDHRHVVKTTVLLKDIKVSDMCGKCLLYHESKSVFNICSENILFHIKDFPAVNAVYAEFFREDPPARATFQVTLIPPSLSNHSWHLETFTK